MADTLRQPLLKPVEERFWSHVTKTDTCWLWKAFTDQDGYGRFNIDGKMLLAHRVSWILAGNEIPEGTQVLHKCDTPPCVWPNHLFLGTTQDNSDDMVKKGRHTGPKGEKNGMHKLTEVQILEIRELYSRGNISQYALADKYNVTQPLINQIVNRKLWS